MRIDCIGHASLFITTKTKRILMDPIFGDPHQEGLFDVFPKRSVALERLPIPDLLIISHKHLDHFDIRSLAALPTRPPVIIPKDPLLERFLKLLGFATIHLVSDFSEIKLGETTVFTTRSENPVPEFGVVIADSDGTVWNQVDSVVSLKTVQAVRQRYNIDLVIASWQPMLETNFTTNRPVQFPYDRYSEILSHIRALDPKAVVPGANAFCYTQAAEWMNSVVFPQTRERFLEDLACLIPHAQTLAADPGDVLHLLDHRTSIDRMSSSFVSRIEQSRSLLYFNPISVDSRLVDSNPNGVDISTLQSTETRIMTKDLPEVLCERRDSFTEHREWQAVYSIQVVGPAEISEWTLDFRPDIPIISSGRSPLANIHVQVAASALHGLATQTLGWDHAVLGGFYRSHRSLYIVTRAGIVSGKNADLLDPFEVLFPYQRILTTLLTAEYERWATSNKLTLATA